MAKGLAATVACVVLLAAIIIGAGVIWFGWFKGYATNRTTHIYEQSYGAQSAYVEQLHQAITEARSISVQIVDPATPRAEVSALRSQRVAVVDQACAVASHVTSQLPPEEESFVASHC